MAQTTAPAGGLAVGKNVLIRTKDVVEPRPGIYYVPIGLSESDGYVDAIYDASDTEDRKIIAQGTKLHYYNGSVTTFSGTYSPADDSNRRMSFATMLQRVYLTTSNGVYRVGGQAGSWSALTPEPAGMYRPLIDFTNSHMVKNTSGNIAKDRAVAFRCYLLKKDGNGREIRGPASNRTILIQPPTANVNAGGIVRTGGTTVTVTTTAAHGFRPGDAVTLDAAEVGPPAFGTGPFTIVTVPAFNQFTYSEAGANGASAGAHTYDIGALAQVSLRVLLPTGVTTSHVLRAFRSETASSASITPSDDTYQFFEGSPNGTDISNGYMTLTDNTPEVILGPISYFSPSADGLGASNESPPFAKTLAAFGGDNGRLLAGNVRETHRYELAILATGGASGIAAGNTLTFTRTGFSNFTITWGTSIAAGTAILYSAGSVASDIERSALSLVDAVNSYTSNTFLWARYISGPDDAPGRILFEARDTGAAAFTVVASANGTAFNPVLSSAQSSTQATFVNRMRWSASGQADAFWDLNYADLGAADDEILAIAPLKENLIVIKERSAYLGAPTGSGFTWVPIETAMRFVGADTVGVLNNQVHVLSTSGLAVVSESGVSVISLPVDDKLNPLFLEPLLSSADPTADPKNLLRRVCFGLVRPTDGIYLLSIPEFDGALGVSPNRRLPKEMLCWNSKSRTWTSWDVVATCGAWNSAAGMMTLGASRKGQVRFEQRRLGQSSTVLAPLDDAVSVTVSSVDSTAKTAVLVDTSRLSAGDALLGGSSFRLITAVNHATNTVTLESVTDIAAGATTALVAYEAYVEWLPIAAEDPAGGKAFHGAQLHFKKYVGQLGELLVGSELAPSMVRSKYIARDGWGSATWGTTPWGTVSGPRNERGNVPPNTIRGAWMRVGFRIRDVLSKWELQGMTPIFEQSTDRTKR